MKLKNEKIFKIYVARCNSDVDKTVKKLTEVIDINDITLEPGKGVTGDVTSIRATISFKQLNKLYEKGYVDFKDIEEYAGKAHLYPGLR